jgi:hypothetical protein
VYVFTLRVLDKLPLKRLGIRALSLGRTTMGWMSPPDRMDSASSSSFFWSNVLRGLVLDSKSWSMAMYWNSLLFCMMRSLGCGWWLGL